MKSFAAFVLLAASAATAQTPPVTYNSTTGVFNCPASHPNGAYCAGTSLETNIIIRCTNGIGTPGNCNDNLAGEPPSGVWYAPCWETSPTSADAACSKNCIVYAANGTFTAPGCIPISSTTSVSSSSTSSSASSSTPTTSVTSSTTSVGSSSVSASSSASSASSITVYTTLSTTTYCPSSTLSSVIVHSSSSKCVTSASSAPSSSTILATGTGSSSPSSNHTSATGGAGGTSSGGSSATATPVGPTATNTPVLTTSGAIANSGSILAAVGLFIAYFL